MDAVSLRKINWLDLLARLKTVNEGDCKCMIEAELSGKNRLSFLLKMFSRYNQLRYKREMAELVAKSVSMQMMDNQQTA